MPRFAAVRSFQIIQMSRLFRLPNGGTHRDRFTIRRRHFWNICLSAAKYYTHVVNIWIIYTDLLCGWYSVTWHMVLELRVTAHKPSLCVPCCGIFALVVTS